MSLLKRVRDKKATGHPDQKYIKGQPNVTFTRKTKTGPRRKLDPKTRTYKFRSGWEREFFDANKTKIKLDYEPFVIKYSRLIEGRYIPDFVFQRQKDEFLVYECKGQWTSADRTRLPHIIASNPGLVIIMVFQRDNKLSKTSRTRYSEYCLKRGIPYCIGTDISKVVWPHSVKGKLNV